MKMTELLTIKIIENILDNDLITPEYLEKLREKFF